MYLEHMYIGASKFLCAYMSLGGLFCFYVNVTYSTQLKELLISISKAKYEPKWLLPDCKLECFASRIGLASQSSDTSRPAPWSAERCWAGSCRWEERSTRSGPTSSCSCSSRDQPDLTFGWLCQSPCPPPSSFRWPACPVSFECFLSMFIET